VCNRLGVQDYLSKPPDHDALLKTFERALLTPATDEQFMVVTMRLPARVLQTLTEVDPNLERAITRICDECGMHVKAMSAKQ
jgi:ActR/RegA family two-component response regulator